MLGSSQALCRRWAQNTGTEEEVGTRACWAGVTAAEDGDRRGVRDCWGYRGCRARVWRQGQQGLWGGAEGRSTGHRLGRASPKRAEGPRGLSGGAPPAGPLLTAPARRGRVSAHGGSGSSVAASPGGASPAGLPRRPPFAGARARQHRLPGTCRAPLRSPRAAASTAAPSEPPDHGHRLRVPWAGVQRCWEREAPRSERWERRGGSEHRARARRRGGASGRVRAAGAGRTCVCLCRSPTGGRAAARRSFLLGKCRDLARKTVGSGALAP